jgi:vacuolar-type H+-ATPase subunit H
MMEKEVGKMATKKNVNRNHAHREREAEQEQEETSRSQRSARKSYLANGRSKVEDTLDKVENLVVRASHVPLTGKSMIDENDLIHLVEELREDLPMELGQAKSIMDKEQAIIQGAHEEADRIVNKAQDYAEQLTDEHEIVQAAKQKALKLEQEAKAQREALLAQAKQKAEQMQKNADDYVNSVFDQLINHVTETAKYAQQSVNYLQQSVASIDQARGVLQQAKDAMNSESMREAASQPPEEQAPQEEEQEPEQA